jgi:hypothetical protein
MKKYKKIAIGVLLSVSFTAVNAADDARSIYVESCMRELPSQPICECIYDQHAKSLTKEEMLNSDVTFNFRKKNNIKSPAISEASQKKILNVAQQSMGACFK